jgi:uncharacterized protein YigA (DUF484 family)
MKLNADTIADYLRENPAFFEKYQDLLAHLSMPHPHGGRAISLTERQVLMLREKNRALEAKLAELIRFGEENDTLGERVHRLSIALIKAPDWANVQRLVKRHLIEDFSVPHLALRLWAGGDEGAEVDAATREAMAALSHPYCGPADARPGALLLAPGAGQIRSLCEIPLRRGAETFGVLVLGSEDAQRFYTGMGTLFLSQIGNLVASAATRTLNV